MRKIHMHGHLGEKFGTLFELDVSTAGEALRALCFQLKGLEGEIRAGSYHVIAGSSIDDGLDLDGEGCASFNLGRMDIHFVPVIAGSKSSGGLIKVVLGVVLIGAAFALSGGALGTAIGASGSMLGGVTYGNMAMFGVAIAGAGVSQMLSPESSDEDTDESYLFSGPSNSYTQGSPIPLVYGEVITGGMLISGGVDVEQLGD